MSPEAVVAAICQVAALRFGSSPHRILARSRCQADNDARVLAMALANDALRECTVPHIAEMFRRSHGAIIDAARVAEAKRFQVAWTAAREVLSSRDIEISPHPLSPGGRAGRPSIPSVPARPTAGSAMRAKERGPAISRAPSCR